MDDDGAAAFLPADRVRVPRTPPPAALAGWWARRTLRVRITIAVAGVAIVALGALAWLAAGLVGITVTGAVDVELARAAANATGQLSAGVPEDSVVPSEESVDGVSERIVIRVTDTAGHPLDGNLPLPLDPELVRRLASGDAVTVDGPDGPTRWLGVVAIAPNGSPRLVLAAAHLIGYTSVLRRGTIGLALAALLAAIGVALAAWTAAGLALRPVARMRAAAVTLPPGERLPVPPARDELRALADELNELLARRDNATARLEAFTGAAAHELRSPVAAIRAQAEVAVLHPDPELAEETLRSVATEAARLSELVSDLLALARADAGARPPATAVDVRAEARAAIARAEQAAEADLLMAISHASASGGERKPASVEEWEEAAHEEREAAGHEEREAAGHEEWEAGHEEREAAREKREAAAVGARMDTPRSSGLDSTDGFAALDGAEPPEESDAVAEPDLADEEPALNGPELAGPPVITLTAPAQVFAAASPGEVALVLDNLLGNACRYARSRVSVSVLPAGRTVRLLVDDDGPGVPEADRRRVFDRFTRLEADRGGRSGGAGLGLALVMALVTGRGGTARMAESPERGARVEVRWPTATPSDPT